MSYTLQLKERTALVTGGTRGIGAAIAELFAKAGVNVIITGTRKAAIQKRVKALQEISSTTIRGWEADFTDKTSLASLCDRIDELASLDILINNAGNNLIVPIDEVNSEDLANIMALNLQAPILLSGAAARVMKPSKWGRIINIASIWSVITKPGRAMYTASKFGLVGLTKTTAADLGPYNILVNALSPGFTKTDLTDATVPVDEQERIAQQIPARRFAKPEEMARVALFLCSEMNTYITGQNIVVDGGFVSV